MLVREFSDACEVLWPASTASEWDRPGLSLGSFQASVSAVLLSVDVTAEVLDEAESLGANLIFSHHPLLLRGVSSVAEDSTKGKLVAQAIRAGISVFSAHTNADIVEDGVSDVISKRLNLLDSKVLFKTHASSGHGRIGRLAEPATLGELVERLASFLPSTARGVASSGHAETVVQTIALCGGAGDAFIGDAVASGADAYITSDLRHHVTQESGIPLIDVSHWASESLWLEVAARQLTEIFPNEKFLVSSMATDPWVFNSGRTNK